MIGLNPVLVDCATPRHLAVENGADLSEYSTPEPGVLGVLLCFETLFPCFEVWRKGPTLGDCGQVLRIASS